MVLKIRRQLQTNLAKTSGTGNPALWVTLHQTDNFSRGAGAAAHANLQSRLGTDASWHWQVDDIEAVQSYAENVRCWHAGDGRGHGNMSSIAIEMCVNPDANYEKTFDNGARLAAQIMKRHGIPMSRLVQHNHWSGKNCPSQIRNRGEWARFRALVQKYLTGASTPPTPAPKPSAPVKGRRIEEDGYWGRDTTGLLQEILESEVDRVVSSQSNYWRSRNPGLTSGWEWVDPSKARGSLLIGKMQDILKIKKDYLAGPIFFNALGARYGIRGDNVLDGPSITIKAMQQALNRGTF